MPDDVRYDVLDQAEASFEDQLTNARLLELGGLPDAALAAWQGISQRFPDRPAGILGEARTLRRHGRYADSFMVLTEGLRRFPGQETLSLDQGWACLAMGDFGRAVELWEEFRRRFPANIQGYLGGGRAYGSLQAYDRADEIHLEAIERLPAHAQLLKEFALNAMKRPDPAQAVRRFGELVARFPDEVDGHVQLAAAMRLAKDFEGADRTLTAAHERFPENFEILMAWAITARERRDWPEALRRWDKLIAAHQDRPEGRRFAAEALLELRRPADARTVLAPALRLFPNDVRIAVLNGVIATRLRDPAAEQAWRVVYKQFPDEVSGYSGLAAALWERGRVGEAATILEEAAARFPANAQIAIEAALVPQRKQDWDLAVEKWQGVVARFPDLPRAYIGLGEAFVGKADVNEAESFYADAVRRFPDDFDIAAARGHAVARLRGWPAALDLWQALAARFPDNAASHAGYGRALRETGALAVAQDTLRGALRQFPDNAEIETQLAHTLSALRDWPAALPLWESLKRRYPDDRVIHDAIVLILPQAIIDQGLALSGDELAPPPFDIPELVLKNDSDHGAELQALRALLMGFESIGDTCEFGVVQRRFGAEPVSLLRWTSTPPDLLTAALDADFAGVGEPEHTIIEDTRGEYTTADRRYHMTSHTFTSSSSEPLEVFARRQFRRMGFLRRKFIDDLKAARKILVYKCEAGLSDTEIAALDAALRRYSARTKLLCVRIADAAHAAGTLEPVAPGLLVGYIDKFSNADPSFEIWLDLCQRAAAIFTPD